MFLVLTLALLPGCTSVAAAVHRLVDADVAPPATEPDLTATASTYTPCWGVVNAAGQLVTGGACVASVAKVGGLTQGIYLVTLQSHPPLFAPTVTPIAPSGVTRAATVDSVGLTNFEVETFAVAASPDQNGAHVDSGFAFTVVP